MFVYSYLDYNLRIMEKAHREPQGSGAHALPKAK